MVERDPNDDKNVIVEIRPGAGGDEAGAVGRRPLPDADPLRRAPRLQGRAAVESVTATTRSPSRATAPTRCSSSRAGPIASSASRRPSPRAGSTPRRRPSPCFPRPRTSRSRSTPGDLQIDVYRSSGPGRPVGQHDRLGGAHHPQADRDRGLDAGREIPAAEPRAGDAGPARPPVRARARRAAGVDRRQPPGPGRDRRARGEDPHLQLRRAARQGPPHQPAGPQPRWDPDGRARRAHRRPPGRREAPAARGEGRWRDAAPGRGASIGAARARRREVLAAAGCETPRLDAELLLAECCGVAGASGSCSTALARWTAPQRERYGDLLRSAGGARAGGLHPRAPPFRRLDAGGRSRGC